MSEQCNMEDAVAYIRKCLDVLDEEISRKRDGKTSMPYGALLCAVLNAKAAVDRIEETWKREERWLMNSPRTWEECVEGAMQLRERGEAGYDCY